MANDFDLVTYIVAYEEGRLEPEKVLTLFSYLISTGMAWTLQGSYGRAASNFIEIGAIDRQGNILIHADELERII